MSGGSFNYLFEHQGERNGDLDAMADKLHTMGFYELSRLTREQKFAPPQALRDAWHAVEWWESADTAVRDAVLACEKAARELGVSDAG